MNCCIEGSEFMNVTISGAGSAVFPNSNVRVTERGDEGFQDVATFQWMKTAIPAGSTQVVSVKFRTDAGTGSAGFRTANINLFLN
jgi:hypothetical protein